MRTIRRPAPLLVFLALALAGCAATQTTAQTTDIFEAAPWAAQERLRYVLNDGDGELIGHGELIARVEGGRLLLEQIYVEANPPENATPTSDDTVVIVDPATFRPVEGWREIVRRDSAGRVVEERFDWEYRAVEGEMRVFVRHEANGRVSERDFRVRDHYYDNESALWLWRASSLTEGFDEHYVSVNAIEGSQTAVRLHVPQEETVEVPAGEFDTWRVLLRTGRATFTAWINVEPPHQVVRWDNNDLVFDLVSTN